MGVKSMLLCAVVLIRSASPGEVAALQELNDQAFADNPDYDPDLVLDWAQSGKGHAYFSELLADPGRCCLIAEDESRLVGYIAAGPKYIAHRQSSYLEVENLGVIPEYRRQGVAALLLENCLSWAKAHGYQKAYLQCYAKNGGAIEFYERNGFSVIEVGMEKAI